MDPSDDHPTRLLDDLVARTYCPSDRLAEVLYAIMIRLAISQCSLRDQMGMATGYINLTAFPIRILPLPITYITTLDQVIFHSTTQPTNQPPP